MAIFNRLSKEEIQKTYSHVGLFFGFVPVYVDLYGADCNLDVRNWWPEWLLDFAMVLFSLFCSICYFLNPHWENPGFPIKITGQILPD